MSTRSTRTENKDQHHEDNDGGCTMSEYIDVSGTENAYDSGRWLGRSIKTMSVESMSIVASNKGTHTHRRRRLRRDAPRPEQTCPTLSCPFLRAKSLGSMRGDILD